MKLPCRRHNFVLESYETSGSFLVLSFLNLGFRCDFTSLCLELERFRRRMFAIFPCKRCIFTRVDPRRERKSGGTTAKTNSANTRGRWQWISSFISISGILGQVLARKSSDSCCCVCTQERLCPVGVPLTKAKVCPNDIFFFQDRFRDSYDTQLLQKVFHFHARWNVVSFFKTVDQFFKLL